MWIPKNERSWQLSLSTVFMAALRNARTPEDKLWDDTFPCLSIKCSLQVFSSPIQILASKNHFLWKRTSASIFTTSFCLWNNKVNFYNYKNNSYSLRKIIKCEENLNGMQCSNPQIPNCNIWYIASLFTIFYWSIVDLQCCIKFCCLVKWLSYRYTYLLFCGLFHYALIHHMILNVVPELYSRIFCSPILHVKVCICQPQTPNPSHPRSISPRQPQVCSLYLLVCFHCINMLICVLL